MDKKINSSVSFTQKKLLLVAATAAVLFGGYVVFANASQSNYRIEASKLTVAKVEQARFEDYVQLRATVAPKRTIYIDANEGGRVEKKFIEEGSYVTKGQQLLELSNSSLQLGVITREAQITEQLNNLQNTKLAMAQDNLNIRNQLIEFNHKITSLTRLEKKHKRLLAKNLIAQETHLTTVDDLSYYRKKREITLARKTQNEKIRVVQMAQLEESTVQLSKNLKLSRKNLDELIVRAPFDGYLTSLDAELGESIGRGARIGQIDNTNEFKMSAMVDEFYLNRVSQQQIASLTQSGQEYRLVLKKVYPKVQNGQFKVDFAFSKEQPQKLHRGQSFQLKLQLGDEKQALLIPRGGFIQETGGQWIFVLSKDGKDAQRRQITVGRKNPQYLEILSGLTVKDRVITSSYNQFKHNQTLSLVQ